jgi:hypothetical protein
MIGFYTVMQKRMGMKTFVSPEQNSMDYWSGLFRDNQPLLCEKGVNMILGMYMLSCNERVAKDPPLPSNCNYFSQCAKIKLHELQKTLDFMDNPFYNETHRIYMLDVFATAQKTCYAFSKLARMWKIKKSRVSVDVDMSLQKIDPLSSGSITIFQNGTNYLFRLSDLINIIHRALIHSPHFFTDPLEPKNPYTNVPFTKAMLFEIYCAIRGSSYKMPTLFHLYFLSFFDTTKFLYDNEAVIRDIFIDDFIKHSSTNDLYPYVKNMMKDMDKYRRLRIHKDFPKDVLVSIMKPYVHLHMVHVYSISRTDKKYHSFFELQKRLRAFIAYNPIFGRKQIRCVHVRPEGENVQHRFCGQITFNTDHINFYKTDISENRIMNDEVFRGLVLQDNRVMSDDEGSADDGSVDDGSVDDGSVDDGSADDGSADDGSADDVVIV